MYTSKQIGTRLALAVVVWLLLVVALFFVVFVPPAISTAMGLNDVLRGNFTQAHRWWSGANSYVTTLDSLLQQRSSLINGWSHALKLGILATNTLSSPEVQTSDAYARSGLFLQTLPQLQYELTMVLTALEDSALAKSALPKPWIGWLTELARLLDTLEPLLSRESVWLVLLQNSNELRASGGFMGSYALIFIQPGEPIKVNIEDIYDADGQFTGFVQAPPGVSEYLSGGKGMRLPDANWSSDFSLSAQQILAYFALGQKQRIDGVIALNNEVISSLLQITGPLTLPDYDLVLTADTLDAVLHQRPNEFFPGSIQKKHMLSQAQSVLLAALSNLSAAQYRALLVAVQNHIAKKNVLFYSPDPALQALISDWKMSGELPAITEDTDVLALVESNVGINKSNQWISRDVSIRRSESEVELIVAFTNHSSDDRYLNYQRLIVDPNWTMTSVHGDSAETSEAQSTLFTTPNGTEYAEHGFLVSVPANSQRMVRMILDTNGTHKPNLFLVKQSGLAATPFIIITDTQQKLILDADRTVRW